VTKSLIYAIRAAYHSKNNPSIVELLIKYGADVNFRFINHKGFNSVLNEAIKYYRAGPACIEYLLESGADTNARNSRGLTPLAMCRKFSKGNKPSKSLINIIEKLLEHGAKLEKTQSYHEGLWTIQSNELLETIKVPIDDIVNKLQNKKKLAIDLKKTLEKKIYANQSISIKGAQFLLNEAILSTRCPSLCIQLNPHYKTGEDLLITEID
jgi:hypothetical protein